MDKAECRFSWLLKQRGYKYCTEAELEQKIQVINRRPDFFVETPSTKILVEVEAFKSPGPLELRNNRVGSVGPEEFYKRIKNSVKHAAKQLKPYENTGIPCLVVLDNWRRLSIPTDPFALIQVFGTVELKGEFDSDTGTSGPFIYHHGTYRRLTENQHVYVSAIAVNIAKVRFDDIGYVDDMTMERPMKLIIVHNPFTNCTLPKDVFTDEDDEQYVYVANRWGKLPPHITCKRN